MKSREELRETIPGEQSVKIRRVKRGRYRETERETEQRAEMKKFKKLRDCGSEEDHEELKPSRSPGTACHLSAGVCGQQVALLQV